MDAIKKMPDQLNDTAGSRFTDPFAVVMESSPANATREATASQVQPTKAPALSALSSDGMRTSKGENKRTFATTLPVSKAAASLAQKQPRFTQTDDAAANSRNPTDDTAANSRRAFGSTEDMDAHSRNQLTMPQHVNLHVAGLCQSPRLQELAKK
jgi:hypothetical protein